MSNRPRRRLLQEWQTRAIVRAGDSPPDTIQSMEDWNRWKRDAFRFLWREPLRFADNIRPDSGLINIQARNQPELFNPLADPMPDRPAHLREFGNRNDPLFLWEKTEAALLAALEYLEPARRISRPRFAQWAGGVEIIEDYPARFYCGFKKLRIGFYSIDQYSGRGSPWFRDHGSAARNVLRLDETVGAASSVWIRPWRPRVLPRITESELHALMSLAACWWALDALLGLSEDPEQWPRRELDYIAGLIQDAERWLAEAYRLEQSDAKQATIRDAWAADSHREKSAKGGRTPKGSEGVRLLALALRKEKPSVSAEALFNAALSRAGAKDKPLLADAYTITTDAEAKQLFSTCPDGKPDGLPVGLSGWRNIVPPRLEKKS